MNYRNCRTVDTKCEGVKVMKDYVHVVTNEDGEVVYASLNKEKALDFAFENKLIITACELKE